MTDNQKSITAITCIMLAIIAAGAAAASIGIARATTIPAAAAAEANLVCTPFQGLAYFRVEQLAAESDLQHYRVTATCASQHQVTGTIAISKAASAP